MKQLTSLDTLIDDGLTQWRRVTKLARAGPGSKFYAPLQPELEERVTTPPRDDEKAECTIIAQGPIGPSTESYANI